ncbi:nuclear transport factor 2 family protein [Minwuia thermotolerans]|uniref:SnoaL-like domain-containing protein n=1 Tax=Minwuia thermotolerans TaxID=2056226 RepID=A0A2M9G0Y9_9PROT|nr:nuclear transport factor 2 family protein [Minwuia thermotolerans]PJK29344.1 hypothetical protein CVT23_12130 [Minwuia thermotolerans]PJK30471.1 hypothetical protein CVT23_05865 [Minwuia thermotolerans]PJK30694.1 hypothetical protein CVT23_04815 [Minwuia thermotolerans]
MDSLSPSSAGPPADAARLDRFAAFFERMTAADVGRLGEIYAEDVHFADPFSDFRGLDDLRRVFAAMFDGMRDYALSVDEKGMTAADTGMVRWTMSGSVRALGREPWIVHGVSVIRFDAEGRVREHLDYWDAAGQFYERLPVLGWVLRRIRRRIAQH